MFRKKKPNLKGIRLLWVKLIPNTFRLFAEQRWEKLVQISFCKFFVY